MLIVSSWSEQFRSDIGFNGVSQIWGGRPAWYFWLADAPGVYQLEMMDTEEDPDTREDRCTAVFKVKCYPYQERAEFQSFSFLEKKLVQSNLFDDTHTPAFEHQGDIPDDLFTVATVEISMDLEGHAAIFSFESMACLQTRYVQETHQSFELINRERIFRSQEIDRKVPGFRLGYRLFDCLMALYANAHKQSPLEIRFLKTPGFEVVISGSTVDARRTDSIAGYDLGILFSTSPSGDCSDEDDRLMANCEDDEELIYYRRFLCGHYHDSQEEMQLPVRLNRQWWSLAHGQYQSELASSCGCH